VPIPQQEQKCIVIVAGEESASEHNMAMVARADESFCRQIQSPTKWSTAKEQERTK